MDERAASIMEEDELTWVDPKLIKYSQACISREFRNNNKRQAGENNKSASYAEAVSVNRPLALKTNLEHLKAGKLKVTDFPPIRVVSHENILYTLDNRRLWVFRSYGALIPVLLKEVDKEFFQKLSREGDGETVTFITPDDAKDYKMKRTLLSVVLKWSLEDILNDKLLVNKVQPIPMRFNSLSKYLECFKDPLVEETRAMLQQSFEEIQSASYIPLERVEERKSKSKSDSDTQNLKTFMLMWDLDKPIVNRGKKGKLAWKPKPTDMILLTNEVPQSEFKELQRSGVLYTLGILKGSREDDDHVLSATVYAPSESPEYKALHDSKEFFAVQMGNLATGKRIWEALVRALPEENHYMCQRLPILNSLLYSELDGDLRDPESSENPPNKKIDEKELIDGYCVYRGLNKSQSTALKTSVTGLLLELKPRIRLIQGPPGTGKTATLATLLSILSCLKQRTLVCAPTNVAISEVILRFLVFFTANPPAASNNCLLFGQFCGLYRPAEGEDCVQLADLVLIGNDDRLDLDGPLGQVFLDRRVDRLIDALSPVCGWRASTSSLLEFLRSSTMQYETYKETQKNEVGGLSFIKFLKKRLKLLAEKFLDHCHVLGNDLPSRLTSAGCVSVLEKCSMLVKRFLDKVMQSESKVADDMLQCFRESSGVQINEVSTTNNESASGFAKLMHELQDALAAMPDDVTFLKVPNRPTEEWMQEKCLEHARLVFSTVSSAGRHILLKSKPFQCVIVDEASQCVEAETVVVTSMKGVKQMILVGDQMQLPATVISQVAQGCGYGRSLFERLHGVGHPVNLLDVQYRMHPEISMFPNAQFYGGKIQDGNNVRKGRYNTEACQQIFSGPYKFINIREGREQRDEGQTKSWKNLLEVEIVVLLISRIHKACEKAKVEKLSIGVISPYQSQVENLERRLSHYIKMDDITVEVKSVDGFQGREKDIIVFSTVRANRDGNIGFLDDHRRLNVAITRAKYCMWIVGSEKTLTSKDAVWKALFEDAKQRKCILDPGSDSEMTKIIRKVTQELNQLADLLHPNSVLFNGTLWKGQTRFSTSWHAKMSLTLNEPLWNALRSNLHTTSKHAPKTYQTGKVLFAREMKTTITSIKSRETRQHLLNKMLHLANGRRSPYLKPTDLASARYKNLIQVEPVIDYFLVWTVDVENGRQIIKVWNAVQISELSSLVRRLEGGFSMCTDNYIDRCTTKQVDQFKKSLVVPRKWSSAYSIAKYKSLEETKHKPVSGVEGVVDNTKLPLEKSDVDDSVLLMKFYSLSSGIAHQLLTASDGSQLSLPFEVNEQEAAIIQYPRSSFIIGRSGTGKTTVITTKLLQREQEFWIASNGIASPGDEGEEEEGALNPEATGFLKQALVTLSPKLCAAVKHNVSKTRRSMQQAVGGAANADNNSDDVFEEIMLDDEAEAKLMGAIPDNFMHIPRDCYPLVITFRKLLTMLDGSISRSFFSLNVEDQQEDAVIMRVNIDPDTAKVEKHTAEVRVGENGEVVEVGGDQGDIDSRKEDEDFSDVDEEGNLSEEDDDEDGLSQDGKAEEVSKRGKWEGTEVEFERFASTYWPHFDVKFTKNLDPSMVYTEIMSHIKGSVEALRSPHGRLTREDYVAMVERRSSLYTEQQRDNIYSLHLKYEKQKRENYEYDVADLVTHLYLELQKSGGFLGEKMHFLYVDEVQDFTQAQIALFKFICSNLEQGFVFAGDTAQTIARGVGFRFEDARRLYYEEFLGKTEQFAVPQKASSEKKVPDLFQLTMNFRTHMGVVAIADSVVKLLHRFFPNSLDKLDPERSLLHGDVPVFLKTEENRGLVTSLFDMGGTAGGGGCEFGAEQVILVRNSEIKHQILTQIGHKGLVLSVHECKGLEFQDVLLYNFFADSPLRNKWRVIIAYMVEQDLVTNVTFPQFDVKHHNLLCSELKQLYVMLTRARQRLWIYDECFENHQPMLDYWKASGLVKVRQLDASLAEELQGKSSADDWNKRGVKMFNEHHYDAAKLCFDRAGDAPKAQHALAASLQQKAEKLQVTNPKESIRLLREAVELYISIGKGENAVKCYQKIGEYKKAGFVYLEVCKPPNLEAAGDCFAEVKCWQEAAVAYSGINMVKCLTMCWRGKLLDQGLGFIEEWEERRKRKPETHNSSISAARDKKEKLEFEAAKTEFLKKAAAHYHLGKNVGEMMKFVLLFPSLAVRRSFLKRRDYMDQLQFIEEGAGNFEKAAELAEASGNLKYAAKLFEKAGSISLAVEKLLHFAAMEILWKDGNKGWPNLLTPEVIQVLEHALSLVQHKSNVNAAVIHELHIFQSVSSAKIEIYKKSYEQSRKLKVIRLQLLSSYLLLQELARIIKCAIEQEGVENTVISGLLRDQVPNLMEVWDDWSKCIVSFIYSLDRLQKGRGREEDEPMLECIYSYLGVTRQPHTVIVEYSKAHWLADSSLSSLRKEKSNQVLSDREFANLAFQFFDTQLLEVGDLLETVLSDLKKVVNGIVDMKVRFSNLVRVLLLRFNVLWFVLNAKTRDGNTRVQLKTKIIEVATQLYDLLFIDMPAHSMKEVAVIRESPDAQLVFETLAKDLSQTEVKTTSLFRIMSYDQLGKLVTLQPFLGNDWALGQAFNKIEEILRRLPPPQFSYWADFHPKVALWQGSQSQHSAALKSIPKPMPMPMPMPKYQCYYWSVRIQWFMLSLRDIYTIEDFSAPGYLSPMVFLGLFERGVIATCAYSTHLKSMLVTESMALCYMGGKHYEPYYSMLLNSKCVGGHQVLQDLLKDAAHLILELLFQVLELEKWFDISKIDKGMYLPLVVLRLFKLVITICINTDQGQIHKSVLRDLTMLFREQSPVLAKLPSHFKEELQKLFPKTSKQNPPIVKLVTAFSLAMKAMGDPLIVLRRNGRPHAGMSWHTTAQKNLRVVRVEVQLQTYSTFNLAALEQKTIIVGANETVGKTDMEKMGSENEKELKVEDEGEEFFDCDKVIEDDEGAQETSHLISEDSLQSDSSSSFGIPGHKVSKVAPSSMTSDSVILEDGTRLSRAFVEQLKRLLAAARVRIQIPLTPVESYQREARSIFLRKCITDKVYIELFNSKACSLLAHVDEHLMKLNKALDVIKDYERLDDEGELLEKFSDVKDVLEEAVKDLNSKCERHEEMDQFWLHEKIEDVKKLLENSQTELQGPLKKLFKAAGVAVDSQEPSQSGPTPKSGQAQNLPQPNNKANKNKKNKKNKNKNNKK